LLPAHSGEKSNDSWFFQENQAEFSAKTWQILQFCPEIVPWRVTSSDPKYFGVVATENVTTQGHVTISEAVVVYNPSTAVGNERARPVQFALRQNYPNPFNPTTRIEFEIAAADLVVMRVFDLLGREVTTLVNDKLQPGKYEATFEANGLAGGVFLYRLQTSSFTETKQMVLLR
jgi:hypothetical protein